MRYGKLRAAALIAALISLTSCSVRTVGSVTVEQPPETSEIISEVLTAEVTEPPTEPPTAPPDKRVHLIAAGDNLIHYSVFRYAEKIAHEGENYDFKPIYEPVRYLIEGADVAVLNQETIISKSNKVRGADGGALLFNSPAEVADAVVDLGFDVFTMANNHLLDFGEDALRESTEYWRKRAEADGLTVLGTYLDEDDRDDIRIREVNGVKIAFLAFAEHINGFSFANDSPMRVVMTYDEETVEKQIRKAAESADAVVVSVHWGEEDTNVVSDERRELARKMVDWGADVILGAHTHTAETMEWISRGDGSKGFVFYSMGNFVCHQTDNFNLVGEMPDLDIVIDGATGQLRLENVGVIPNIIHYETADDENMRVYPYSAYTSELADKHGIASAVPSGTYTSFGMDVIDRIIEDAIPEEFLKADK